MKNKKPVALLVLDGWGHRESTPDNAITTAHTPVWDHLMENAPHTLLDASGRAVGLPTGQMGNSEVGHLTLGAGRVLFQDLTRITQSIETGDFFENPVLIGAFDKAKACGSAVHLLCLLSPGGVHSHEDHLFALLRMAKTNKIEKLYVHAFLDGRDTPPKSAEPSLARLTKILAETGYHLASLSGRYFAMDRDQRWERTQKAFEAIVHGQAKFYSTSGQAALLEAYARNESDEFVTPTCLAPGADPQAGSQIKNQDCVIFVNFRSDRARALSHALTDVNFTHFDRGRLLALGTFVTLTEYDKTLQAKVAFKTDVLQDGLAEYLDSLQLKQLHIAETEKYAHVTFFFNGGIETPYANETRILIPSPAVATYDLAPDMSAQAITDALIEQIEKNYFDFIVCNFANADMLGHTGNFQATVQSIETLDRCLGRILKALADHGGQALITADHGNAESMHDAQTGQAHTAHTTSWVPLVYSGPHTVSCLPGNGSLADVAPTILYLMGLPAPPAMTGRSRLQWEQKWE